MLDLILIAPAHNEEKLLLTRVQEVIAASQTRPIKILLIAENGSTDRTLQIISQIEGQHQQLKIQSTRYPLGDYGEALVVAMNKVLSSTDFDADWFLLSAADLPFEMSDVDEFLKIKPNPDTILLGSKGHPNSIIQRPFSRKFLSLIFKWIRKILLDLPFEDTQGTVFLPVKVARQILPLVQSRGFFFSTELIYRLSQAGYKILEIPVRLRPEERPTKVKWFKVSLKMLFAIIKLALERKPPK